MAVRKKTAHPKKRKNRLSNRLPVKPEHPISGNFATIVKHLRIRTSRLEIRLLEAKDYPAYREAYLNLLPPQSKYDDEHEEKARAKKTVFDQLLSRQRKAILQDRIYPLHVFHRKTGEHLGGVDFFIYVRGGFQWANVGYSIHNRHWGHGYAPEAVKAAMKLATRKLKLHRLEAATELDNLPSQKVALRAGMKRECVRRKFLYDPKRKKWIDLVVYVRVFP